MDCIFCEIVAGRIPAAIVFEDDISMTFLDTRPLFVGHCLLIPKTHAETLGDLDPNLVGPFFANAQALSRALPLALAAEGSFVAINNRVNQSVPHLHVHVVPRKKKDGMKGFFWPRRSYLHQEEKEQVRAKIAEAMRNLATL